MSKPPNLALRRPSASADTMPQPATRIWFKACVSKVEADCCGTSLDGPEFIYKVHFAESCEASGFCVETRNRDVARHLVPGTFVEVTLATLPDGDGVT